MISRWHWPLRMRILCIFVSLCLVCSTVTTVQYSHYSAVRFRQVYYYSIMVSKDDVLPMSVVDTHTFLTSHFDPDTVAAETLDTFLENRTNGETLLYLTANELLMLIPKLGERRAIQRLIDSLNPKQLSSNSSLVHSQIYQLFSVIMQ